MMTGDNWTEQIAFDGTASAVIIVTGISECAARRFELRLECLGLGTYLTPMPMAVYIWDARETNTAREYYRSIFKVGTCWRISGKIDYDEEQLVFTDPVYMAYSGEACEKLRYAMRNLENNNAICDQ
jgi:hypothetical protein